MLTAEPGPDMKPYHDRQICVLRPEEGLHWLTLSRPESELLQSPSQGTFKVTTLRENGRTITSVIAMPIQSAGILLYRKRRQSIEVFLIHSGGPFWKNKDAGAWSTPKGIVGPQEDALVAARREFKEETGFELDGDFRLLGTFRQPGGTHVNGLCRGR
jgi:hypothetical protein